MSGNETSISIGKTNEVRAGALARHLGVHRNQIPNIAARFGLQKWNGRFGKFDVFRKIHGLEPMLLEEARIALIARHSHVVASRRAITEGTLPEATCLIPELTDISDLQEALWSHGLVHVRKLGPAYGCCYDRFRKKLKAGEINLPPVAPVDLSANRVMYRPLEVALWCRHGIAMNLPRALGGPSVMSMRRDENRQVSAAVEVSDPGEFSRQVFAGAINATDQKSAFEAGTDCLADMLHDFRL